MTDEMAGPEWLHAAGTEENGKKALTNADVCGNLCSEAKFSC